MLEVQMPIERLKGSLRQGQIPGRGRGTFFDEDERAMMFNLIGTDQLLFELKRLLESLPGFNSFSIAGITIPGWAVTLSAVVLFVSVLVLLFGPSRTRTGARLR